jgi:CHAD domain-containing protein
LCGRYGNDNARGFAVSRVASELFERTRHIHGRDARWLEPLQIAAVLHGIGRGFGETRHEAHGRNIILGQGLAGFDGDMVHVVAAAVLLHRGPLLADTDAVLASLPSHMAAPARCVAASLRIAVALADGGAELGRLDDTRKRLCWYVEGSAAAESAASASDLWNRVMPRPLTFRTAGPRQYAARSGDGLQAAGYQMAQGLILTVRERHGAIAPGAALEELHQFRVASRRLRAVLRATRPAFGRSAVTPLSNAIRDMTRATNAVRDLDVMLEAFQGYATPRRAPELWRHMLSDREAREREMHGALHGDAFDRFRREADAFLERQHPWKRPANRRWARKRVRDASPELLTQGLDRVLGHRDGVSAGAEESLHDLRLACKRLRYAAELLGASVPGVKSRVVRPVKAMQASLGDWNDAQVHCAYVARWADSGVAGGHSAALRGILEENTSKRRRALHLFNAQWSEFVAGDALAGLRETLGASTRPIAATRELPRLR